MSEEIKNICGDGVAAHLGVMTEEEQKGKDLPTVPTLPWKRFDEARPEHGAVIFICWEHIKEIHRRAAHKDTYYNGDVSWLYESALLATVPRI